MNKFAEVFREERKRRGFSQREVAKMLKVSHACIGLYENGEREPSFDRLLQIAKLFNVTTEYLLTGREPEAKQKRISSGIFEMEEDFGRLQMAAVEISNQIIILQHMLDEFENEYL